MHKHNWTRDQSGCRENPGVWSEGSRMIYRDRCNCGASRRTEKSIIGGHRGALTTITTPQGDTNTRDTRNWR